MYQQIIGPIRIFFIALFVFSCRQNNKTAERKNIEKLFGKFETVYEKKIGILACWLDSNSVDSSYVIEYQYKSGNINYYYKNSNKHGQYFTPSWKVPEFIEGIISELGVIDIEKRNKWSAYILRCRELDEKASILFTCDSLNLDNIYVEFKDLPNGFSNLSNDSWIYLSGKSSKIAFVSKNISL